MIWRMVWKMVGWFRGWSDAWFGKRKRIPMAKQGSVVSVCN